MIFVTVGTTKFPFDRLLKAVDEVLVKLKSEEGLVVQSGTSNYCFQYLNKDVFKDLPFEEVINYLKNARVIITHGGPATILLALKYGKNIPVVVPRSRKFHEHVNNHQQYYSRMLLEKKLARVIFPDSDLVNSLVEYFASPRKNVDKGKTGAPKILIERLKNYMETIKK